MSGTSGRRAVTMPRVSLEWGPWGAAAAAEHAVAVVIDVLSFTTTVTVAADRGALVYPFAWEQADAPAYARDRAAVLAVTRQEAGPGAVTLSPQSVRSAAALDRVVLPSPNGSALSFALQDSGVRVVAGCLRNRAAVAAALLRILHDDLATVALVPAGERWPDDTLRPAIEDFWGAGAIAAALGDAGFESSGSFSPECRSAAAAFRAVEADIAAALADCASGRELLERGYAGDVAIAAEVDASSVVPTLVEDCFRSM